MACDIYTVGNGERTQMSRREDGVWFVRTKWRGMWGKWREAGRKRPFDCGLYLAPGAGKARLPNGDA